MTELEPSNEQLFCARVSIQGRVQGVGFRYFTRQQAQQWKIQGWIRNRVDGTVEAVFEGTRSQLEQILAWCQEGSPTAQVNQVNVTWENPSKLQGFKQRPTV
jgi:acylphosphatase